MIPVHNHLIGCVLSLISDRRQIRILDAGCGSLGLIESLLRELPKHWGGSIEVYGFDIKPFYTLERFAEIIESSPILRKKLALTRLHAVDIDDYNVPFEDGFFDIIVSNQVIEHVQNLETFYRESFRLLGSKGAMLFCFPTEEVIVEPHLFVPWVHRIKTRVLARRWLKIFWLFKDWDESHIEERLDYLENDTNYRPFNWHLKQLELLELKAAPRFNTRFLVQRLLNLFNVNPLIKAAWLDRFDNLIVLLLARIGSPTIVALKE